MIDDAKSNTDSLGYLGKSFQYKTILELLTDTKFCENIIPYLQSKYFDDDTYKRIVIEIKNYYEKYDRVPSIKNNSIIESVRARISDEIEQTTILNVLDKIKKRDKTRNSAQNTIDDDGDVIQKQIWLFIKQQEYKNLGNFIIKNTINGQLEVVENIEEKIREISKIGINDDMGVDIFSDIDDALEPDYRNTIPTGLGNDIDELMGGGLGNGEMGFVLAGLGTGKTTILTKIANHAHSLGKNVLQIFFEDNKKQIKRKHYAIWSGIPQSKLDENIKLVKEVIYSKKEKLKEGKLVLVKFAQDENITMPYIKRWIINYQKIYGIKFDMIVMDYIDCVESHDKNRNSDPLSNELTVTKAFEAMLAELNIPGWTATQGNRNSLGAEVVTTNQMGGSIKKAQKSHFLLSIARSDDQKERGLANIKILKSRFGRDGITFEDCIFDNDRLMIDIRRSTSSFNTIIESELSQNRTNSILEFE
jgi:hypothetical protein